MYFFLVITGLDPVIQTTVLLVATGAWMAVPGSALRAVRALRDHQAPAMTQRDAGRGMQRAATIPLDGAPGWRSSLANHLRGASSAGIAL